MYGRLSGRNWHSPFYQEHRAWRISGSSKDIKRDKCTSGCLRSCLPTGKTMRIKVYSSENEWETGSYRLSGAFCSWLRTRERTNLRTSHCWKEWYQSGCYRLGTCRIIVCRWYGEIWIWRNCIRSIARNWRCTEIWYSWISSAQQDCWCWDWQSSQNGS